MQCLEFAWGRRTVTPFRGAEQWVEGRRAKAAAVAKRVGLLPVGLNEKLADMLVFCRPAAEYGWLETLPPPAWSKSHNAGIWAAAGKLKFGLHDLKCIISGGALHLEPASFLRQIRVMARRDKVLRQAGMQHEEGTLGRLLRHQLQELGWRLQQGKWKHDLFEQGFRMPQVLQEADWGRIAHALRDSWRRLMYSRMQQSARHELAGEVEPEFCEKRLKLVRKWAGQSSINLCLAVGAIQSPWVRAQGRNGKVVKCPRCDSPTFHWENIWTCQVGKPVPEDVLLRRFGWPRDEEDLLLSLCNVC